MEGQEFDVGEYVDQMSLLLDLQLRDEYRDGVVANFERIKAIAHLVNSFALPQEVEAAPVFAPLEGEGVKGKSGIAGGLLAIVPGEGGDRYLQSCFG